MTIILLALCNSSRSSALGFPYADKIFAQLNGCTGSTSPVYACMTRYALTTG